MVGNYRNLDFELYVRLHDLQNMLLHYEVEDDFYNRIDNYMELIRTKQYRVAVIGEFSRGKSSLINALLGSRILPADITPTTATINRITFDIDSHVDVRYRNGTVSHIDINELSEYVTKLTKENEKTAEVIEEAVIYYPTVICQNNIDLIDTPGLNEDPKMTKLTVSQLEKIDAAIVLVSALSPVDEIEKDLIATLVKSPEIDCIIFAVSFIDQIDPDDRDRLYNEINKRIHGVYEKIKSTCGEGDPITLKAQRMLEKAECYGVSAYQALKAIEKNNGSLLRESCLPGFQKELYRILTAEQSRNALVKTLRMIARSGSYLDGWYDKKKKKLDDQLNDDKLSREMLIKYFDGINEEFEGLISDYVKPIDNYCGANDLTQQLENICIGILAEVRTDSEDAILQAIKQIEISVNEAARQFEKNAAAVIAADASRCAAAVGAKCLTELSDIVVKFAPGEEVENLSNIVNSAIDGLDGVKLAQFKEYSFFSAESLKNGIYVPDGTFMGNSICFEIINLRHFNYIGFIKMQLLGFAARIKCNLGEYMGIFKSIISDIKNGFTGRMSVLFELCEQKIKSSSDDLVVNEKLFIKHREDMAALAEYADETIRTIQATKKEE